MPKLVQPYNKRFYQSQREGSLRSAEVILPFVNNLIHPDSVIDVGCGVGTWLYTWKKLFNVSILGIDGNYVHPSQLMIKDSEFLPVNLNSRTELNSILRRRFDLVESLEVAEHLLPKRADSFVEDLTNLGNVILFSAAITGQGGTRHINEQMQSYWAEKFVSLGYVGIDCIRPFIWNNSSVEWWYRQNTLIYCKASELRHYPKLYKFYKSSSTVVYDIIHPELWNSRLKL